MIAGDFYLFEGEELEVAHLKACKLLGRYNRELDLTYSERLLLLRDLMIAVGNDTIIKPPFYRDYGFNLDIGRSVLINFNCVVLDQAMVQVGDFTRIDPGVQILTADHPRDPVQRKNMIEFARPVRVGANVWIGAGAYIPPSATTGDDVIVGAGGGVTRDVAAGETVVGAPARPISRAHAAREVEASD